MTVRLVYKLQLYFIKDRVIFILNVVFLRLDCRAIVVKYYNPCKAYLCKL